MENLKAIMAVDSELGIGKDGKIPWHSKEDFKWFKSQTINTTVVMGRKTFESLDSKPLPNRRNIVLTTGELIEGVECCHNKKDLLETVEGWETWIIGGSEIYDLFQGDISEFYVSHFTKKYDCDTHLNAELFRKISFLKSEVIATHEEFKIKKYYD